MTGLYLVIYIHTLFILDIDSYIEMTAIGTYNLIEPEIVNVDEATGRPGATLQHAGGAVAAAWKRAQGDPEGVHSSGGSCIRWN